VIAGGHVILYAEDAERARAFVRDVLGFHSVDAGAGWLIFALPPTELAVHPGTGGGQGAAHHELFLMCHDVKRMVDDLQRKGVEFVSPITEARFGLMTRFKIPGAGEIGLYEPKHPSPLAEFGKLDRSRKEMP
jgi:catechol 2,3-dioxygenase-like lactoylglutathione lyase family enzyme